MKNSHLLILLLFTPLTFFAQVGIDNNNPHPASVLDLSGSVNESKGLLIPKVNSLGEVIIDTAGADGMLVYLKGEEKFYRYDESENNWVMVNPFRKVNGDNVAYVPGNVTVSDTLQSSAVSTDQLVVPGFSHNALVPSGVIVMWSGDSSTVPEGWKLCDGTNGTPDLRGRFVYGYDPSAPVGLSTRNPGDFSVGGNSAGTTSGQEFTSIGVGNLPPHHHAARGEGATITINSSGSHDHTWTEGIPQQDTGPTRTDPDENGATDEVARDGLATELLNSGAHSHSNTNFSGVVGDGSDNGLLGFPMNNLPPYYVLAFIMKE